MKNGVLIKLVATIVLLGSVIVTSGVGVGAVALQADQKEASAAAQATKETKENKIKEEKPSEKAELLSEFETENGEEANRDKNLEIACSKINGYEIKPGMTFSFIEVAGPLTEEQGYVKAAVILSDTEMGEDIAGGVCQVSTTLYNAALQGDMEIVERKRHSFPMNYVSVGLDASISTPDIDLKLKNNSEQSIYIFASTKKGKVNVQLFGKPLNESEEIRIRSVVTEEVKPEGVEVRFSDELGSGERQVLQEERTGYEVSVYREYYKDNELVKKQDISEDAYPAIQGIVLEGSANISK